MSEAQISASEGAEPGLLFGADLRGRNVSAFPDAILLCSEFAKLPSFDIEGRIGFMRMFLGPATVDLKTTFCDDDLINVNLLYLARNFGSRFGLIYDLANDW